MRVEERERREEIVRGIDVLVEDGGGAVGGARGSRGDDVVRVARLPGLEIHEVGERGVWRHVRDDRTAVGDGEWARAERAHDFGGEAVGENEDRLVRGEEAPCGLDRNGRALQSDGARRDFEEAGFDENRRNWSGGTGRGGGWRWGGPAGDRDEGEHGDRAGHRAKSVAAAWAGRPDGDGRPSGRSVDRPPYCLAERSPFGLPYLVR